MADLVSLTPKQILDLPMRTNDAGAKTIREYLIKLLAKLWVEGECFSGKRPFGNSGWQDDFYLPLIVAGAVSGTLGDYGFIKRVDDKHADKLIISAIKALGDHG